MKIIGVETFLANAGLRNYLFIRLKTDGDLTGVGEASLEWREKTVETLLHEWVEDRILGKDPFDVERVIGGMIRDQYQGGSTIMTAISGVEIAMWDIIGKACGQPVYRACGNGPGSACCRPRRVAGDLVHRCRPAGHPRGSGRGVSATERIPAVR